MKISPEIRAVVFDLDNTLFKTHLDYVKLRLAIPAAIKELGVPPEKITSDGRQYVLDAQAYLEKQGKKISETDILDKMREKMNAVEMETAHLSQSFPENMDMLRKLKSDGYKIGILTNGFDPYVYYNLDKFSMRNEFDAIVTYDDVGHYREKPRPDGMFMIAEKLNVKCSEILYLGDSKGDYKCCVAAGANFVGVTTGSMTEEKWKEFAPEITVIKTVVNLLD